MEKSGWSLVGRISTSPRYVTDIIGPDPLSLGELGGSRVLVSSVPAQIDFITVISLIQCFREFGASGRARTMKIGRCVRDLHKLT